MCGTGEYSISDFKSHHIANGNSAEFRRVLAWFWAGVSNFSQTEMARLLQFTTGCSQLPPGGFQELNPQFQITAAPTFGNLPTAHTWWVKFFPLEFIFFTQTKLFRLSTASTSCACRTTRATSSSRSRYCWPLARAARDSAWSRNGNGNGN